MVLMDGSEGGAVAPNFNVYRSFQLSSTDARSALLLISDLLLRDLPEEIRSTLRSYEVIIKLRSENHSGLVINFSMTYEPNRDMRAEGYAQDCGYFEVNLNVQNEFSITGRVAQKYPKTNQD